MSPRPRSVVYHQPREHRRSPAVLVAAVGLGVLVIGQLAVADALPWPGEDRPEPLAAATPAPVGPTEPPSTEAGPAAGPSVEGGDLEPVPVTTVTFEVGAVLDAQALAELDPVLAVLTVPGAAPVLLTGSAEPGPDDASDLRLAGQRADAVGEALVAAGVPASLLRTAAVVDPDAGRTVVVAPEVP